MTLSQSKKDVQLWFDTFQLRLEETCLTLVKEGL